MKVAYLHVFLKNGYQIRNYQQKKKKEEKILKNVCLIEESLPIKKEKREVEETRRANNETLKQIIMLKKLTTRGLKKIRSLL